MDLSIIIVNHNTCELLINCITSVNGNSKTIDFEIIVVDNNSKDDSVSRMRELFPKVMIIENNQNVGFATANNQAIRDSKGEVVLLLNPDTIVVEGAIEKSYEFLCNHPDAGVVGCKLLNTDYSIQPSCRSFPSIWNHFSESFFLYKLFPKSRIFGRSYMTFFSYDRIMKVDVVIGAFMMIKREVFDDIGLLDESFFMYSEETDFCLRARQQEWEIYYYPDAQIIHIWGGMSDELPVNLFVELHKSLMKYCYKHHPSYYAHIEKIIIIIGVVLRYIHSQIIYVFNKEKSINGRKKKYLKTLQWYMKGR